MQDQDNEIILRQRVYSNMLLGDQRHEKKHRKSCIRDLKLCKHMLRHDPSLRAICSRELERLLKEKRQEKLDAEEEDELQ